MFTPSTISPAVGLTLCLAASAASADGPGLGKALTEADIAAWNISIEPDGTGLPPGAGTPAQGAHVYAEKCAAFTQRPLNDACTCLGGDWIDARRANEVGV